MHPLSTNQMAALHRAELLREADQARRVRAGRAAQRSLRASPAPPPWRRSLGFWFVALGLRPAAGRPQARPATPAG